MSCEKCLHYEACDFHFDLKEYPPNKCDLFKDKSRIIELPCGVGDTFYAIVNGQIIAYNCVGFKYGHSAVTEKDDELLLLTVYDMEFVFGEEAFLSNEEAEAKLKELNEKCQ